MKEVLLISLKDVAKIEERTKEKGIDAVFIPIKIKETNKENIVFVIDSKRLS